MYFQVSVVTPRKAVLNLISRFTYAQKCLSRARVTLFRLNKSINRSKSASVIAKPCLGICHELDALPATTKQFFINQIRAFAVSPLGMRWSQQDKLIALRLYYKRPAAYRFMRRTYRLPTEQTLRS